MLNLAFGGFLIADLVVFYRRFLLERSRRDIAEKEAQKNIAIASVAQMLAHDVRKPLSMVKMFISSVNNASSINEARRLIEDFSPDIDRIISSVNGMIKDVMELGSTAGMVLTEPAHPESLLVLALGDVIRIHPQCRVDFAYDFQHHFRVMANSDKIMRVITNIIENAVHAMNGQGKMWFHTADQMEERGSFIRFCIGNSGSFIARHELTTLFEAFYTKGKKEGHGLGLAIAKKIIEAHGGKIWCDSSPERGVEFFFTLPAEKTRCEKREIELPCDSRFLLNTYKQEGVSSALYNESFEPSIVNCESQISDYCAFLGRPLRIAIIDDESIYRSSLREMLKKPGGADDKIEVLLYNGAEDFFESFSCGSYDFIICDIDLGRGSMDGYEVVTMVRKQDAQVKICIHSNRNMPEDYRLAISCGAQAFLPKPISRILLLKFIVSGIDASQTRSLSESEMKPQVIFVDDDRTYRVFATRLISDARVITFDCPESLLRAIEHDPQLLTLSVAVMVDQHYGSRSQLTGTQLGTILKGKLSYRGAVILFTNEETRADATCDNIDIVLPKQLKPWRELERELASPANRRDAASITSEEAEASAALPLTAAEQKARLRHDIRGHLGAMELILSHLSTADKEQLFRDISCFAAYLEKVRGHLPSAKVQAVQEGLRALESGDADGLKQAALKERFSALKEFHYFHDPRWLEQKSSPAPVAVIASKEDTQQHAKEAGRNMLGLDLTDGVKLHSVAAALHERYPALIVTHETSWLQQCFLIATDKDDIIAENIGGGQQVIVVSVQDGAAEIVEKLSRRINLNQKTLSFRREP
jgi:nitrogen-specific signal transduction histidine kinase/CheY-like chemotaxis protein